MVVGDPYGAGACNAAVTCVPYFQPSSFVFPAAGTFGDIGKGSLRGPRLVNWDTAFYKEFAARDRWRFQLRGEFFNALNRANFNAPVTSMNAGGFGSIRGAADPRIGQLALKILF